MTESVRGTPRRLILFLLVVVVSAVGGAWLLYWFQANRYQAQLERQLAESRERLALVEKMVDRLTRTRRLAQIVVTKQTAPDPEGNDPGETELLFVELDDAGKTVSKQCFTIPGAVAFFDGLVVKFDFESVKTAAPLKGHSLALLRRVYSEIMPAAEGIPIDRPGEVPGVYATQSEPAEFERELWERFWELADDPAAAAEMGVRVAQGEAVYKPVRPGVLYELTIDAAGGLNLETKPLPEAVAEVLAAVGGIGPDSR